MAAQEEEARPTPMVITCRTEGCELEGVSKTVPMYPAAVPPTWRAVCQPCGQTITDIVPVTQPTP